MNLFLKILPYALRALTAAPSIIQAINFLHAEKDTASKTQLAHDVLMISQGAAEVVDPADSQLIDAASTVTHAIISSVGGFRQPVAVSTVLQASQGAAAQQVVALDPLGHPIAATN